MSFIDGPKFVCVRIKIRAVAPTLIIPSLIAFRQSTEKHPDSVVKAFSRAGHRQSMS